MTSLAAPGSWLPANIYGRRFRRATCCARAPDAVRAT